MVCIIIYVLQYVINTRQICKSLQAYITYIDHIYKNGHKYGQHNLLATTIQQTL